MLRRSTTLLSALALGLALPGCGENGEGAESETAGLTTAGSAPDLDEGPVCVGPAAIGSGVSTALLTPVLFVPQGSELSDEEAELVDGALGNVDGWFRRELDGSGLRLAPPVIVQGAHPVDYYLEENRAWDVLPDELSPALGFGPWSPGHGAFVLGVGFGSYSCGDGNSEAGMAIIGLDSLLDRDSCVGAYWCSEGYWVGDAIRDVGYLLSLDEGLGDSIMAPWSNGSYIDRVLLLEERQLAMEQPFIVTPKEEETGLDDWQTCTSDSECASGRCGCNGWHEPVCLPDERFPKACTPKPFCGDALCVGDESCGSCPEDCGLCPPACGDGECNGDETCQICPVDCGACPPTCGDTVCNNDESCNSCPGDCGPCPCPCSGDQNVDNFCNFAPNTPGCAMTSPGGYCDPNGNSSYDDADWEHGYYEYLFQCG